VKMLASVLLETGTVELEVNTPLSFNGPDATIGLVLPGSQVWLTLGNARALAAFLEFAIKVKESGTPEVRP